MPAVNHNDSRGDSRHWLSSRAKLGSCVRCLTLTITALSALVAAQNPVPQIVGPVKPTAVAPGSGSFTLTVYGANFVSGAVVNWNGQARSTTFISARELQAQILATDVATNTAGTISVTNPPPGGGNSSEGWAQVEVHVPTSAIVANPPYIVPVPYNFTYGFLMADFNGDNKLDMFADSILMLGNGNGKFHFGSTVRNYDPYQGDVYGDFNGDGKLDLAYVSGNIGLGQQIVVALGDGRGKFAVASTLKAFSSFYVLAAGDLNGDGKLDLVASKGKTLSVFLGNGDGTFQPRIDSPFPGSGVGTDIVPGDFNGDGKLDLLTLDQYGDIYLLIGQGNGKFKYPPVLVSSGENWICAGTNFPVVLASDFNSDGKLDLLACRSGELGVFLGNGDGTFQESVYSVPPSENSLETAVGDFNSDGKIDVLLTEVAQSNVLVFWGKGDGTFESPQVVNISALGGIAVGDLNSDGLVDLVFLGTIGDAVVYIQQ
jgi:FG-GAP-like repeat